MKKVSNPEEKPELGDLSTGQIRSIQQNSRKKLVVRLTNQGGYLVGMVNGKLVKEYPDGRLEEV